MSLHPEIDYAQHSGDHSDGGPNSNSLPNHPTLSLPSEILHPDDAKDKVFTAILKALVVLDNKPSSPKELANCIIKHRFTLLGGATPYATVSSRISQHFKRALEHKPPRAPLLARIVDEHHSRKIHYYLANEAVRAGLDRFTSIPSQPQPQPPQPLKPLKEFTHLEGGYPKLKILLKKRKNSMLGNHVFKRYKTMLSGARPGVGTGRGKGKWAPHAHYRSSTRVCADNNSGSGSDADIDEVDSDSGNESPSDLHASTTIGGALSCDPSFSQPLATASLESREAIKEPPLDGEYSDYFEEMMNGDWYMDSYEADPLATKQNKASPPPSAQRASSNTAGNRANPGPSNTAPRTPARKAAETELSQENAVLLTPDTASLFGREFDSHLIPNFGDEFAADSAYAPLMDLNNPETLPMSELDEIFNGSPRRHDLTPRRLFEDHSPMRTHLSHDITRPENPQGSMDISKQCDDPRLPSKGDVSLMDVDAEPLNDTHEPCAAVPEVTSSSNASSHTAMTTGGASDDPLEGAYPMSLTIDEFIPKVTNKIYSNIQVYEVVLPEPPYRLMRFHSNVATPPNDPKCHGRSVVILEESRHKDFCNASLLRKAARTYESHGKPERNDAYTRFVVIRNGPPECRGVWVSLERARQLAAEYGIQDVPHIQQLLSRDPLSENRETMYDPVEMDKHLVELSGILTTNPTPEYDFAQESNLEDETPYSAKASAQSENTGPCGAEDNVEGLDADTYISLDQDDEEPGSLNSPPETADLAPSTSAVHSPSRSEGSVEESLIPTRTPTTPAIYLTEIESTPVYVTYLSNGPNSDDTIQLMRRFDSGYVNGTKLLMLGGVETESERTIVLSLEVGRVRVRKVDSQLFGTWIPLPRARALASTCSLQHKLGPFLDDKLSTYFSKPLPSFATATKPMGLTSRLQQVLKAKAATLPSRNVIGASIGISPQSLHPSKSYFSGPNYHIYQILGLQGSKQSKSAALSGIFGGPTVVSSHDEKKWSKKVKSRFVNGKRTPKGSRVFEAGQRKGRPTSSHLEPTGEEVESDVEVEEVRKTIQTQRLSDEVEVGEDPR